MDLFEILTILSCVSSTITMVLVIVAVLPHVKNGMAVIRDAVLWVAFMVVVGLASWLGWQRVMDRAPTATAGPAVRALRMPPVEERPGGRVSSESDPFYVDRDR